MKINKAGNNKTFVLMILGLMMLVPPAYYAIVGAFAYSPQPFLEMPHGKDKCIRDTMYMRQYHMILLKESRSEAVREGKNTDIGFKKCSECHTNKERFCDRCHDAANLKPDCYRCHYYPTPPVASKG